jgi:cbb3-type cytochrome oxidase subunit 1
MPRMDVYFLLLAAICLVLGVSLGIFMGIKEDFQLAPVHAHVNLVGWASLALFSVIYRVFPELSTSRLATVHFWLAAPSAPVFPVGIYLASMHQIPVVAIIASLLWLAGAVVFFIMVIGMTLSQSEPARLRTANGSPLNG